MILDTGLLGEWTSPVAFDVTGEQAAAYAAATDDPDESRRAGDTVPSVFAVVPAFKALTVAMQKIDTTKTGLRYAHGEQLMVFHEPLRPGTTVYSTAATLGIHPRGSGTVLFTGTRTTDDRGVLLNEQRVVTFFRETFVKVGEGEPPFELATRDEQQATGAMKTTIADDQTQRYAAASGDYTQFHLDEQAALDAGFPGVILHGLCSLAMVSAQLETRLKRDEPAFLHRLGVRFAAPVPLSSAIHTEYWGRDSGVFGFESSLADGTVALSRGLLELSR